MCIRDRGVILSRPPKRSIGRLTRLSTHPLDPAGLALDGSLVRVVHVLSSAGHGRHSKERRARGGGGLVYSQLAVSGDGATIGSPRDAHSVPETRRSRIGIDRRGIVPLGTNATALLLVCGFVRRGEGGRGPRNDDDPTGVPHLGTRVEFGCAACPLRAIAALCADQAWDAAAAIFRRQLDPHQAGFAPVPTTTMFTNPLGLYALTQQQSRPTVHDDASSSPDAARRRVEQVKGRIRSQFQTDGWLSTSMSAE